MEPNHIYKSQWNESNLLFLGLSTTFLWYENTSKCCLVTNTHDQAPHYAFSPAFCCCLPHRYSNKQAASMSPTSFHFEISCRQQCLVLRHPHDSHHWSIFSINRISTWLAVRFSVFHTLVSLQCDLAVCICFDTATTGNSRISASDDQWHGQNHKIVYAI